jgi:hypothetical protein
MATKRRNPEQSHRLALDVLGRLTDEERRAIADFIVTDTLRRLSPALIEQKRAKLARRCAA